MITSAQVNLVFKRWLQAGLEPPFPGGTLKPMIDAFLLRFKHMDVAGLEYVAQQLIRAGTWPSFKAIRQAYKAYESSNGCYVYFDYLRQCQELCGQMETVEQFLQRLAQQYCPEAPKQWCEENAFVLHFYVSRVERCRSCEGSCPYYGHRYLLRMKKGGNTVEPWCSLDVCSHFKQSEDKQYKPPAKDASWEESVEQQEQGAVPQTCIIQPNIFAGTWE